MHNVEDLRAGQIIFGPNPINEPLIIPRDGAKPVTVSSILLAIIRDGKTFPNGVHQTISRLLLGSMPKSWISEDDCLSGIGYTPIKKCK